jgi:pyruvate dehydrogenase complex dehydrogenase (E1) component
MSELRSRRAWRAWEKHDEGLRGPHLRVPFHRYAGQHGRVVSIERFGASAAGAEVLERFGIAPEDVVRAALESLKRSRERIVATPA